MQLELRSGRTEHVEHKADEAVVAREGEEDRVDEDDVLRDRQTPRTISLRFSNLAYQALCCMSTHLEVVNNTLPVQEVVGDNEEVPIPPHPRIKSHQPREIQAKKGVGDGSPIQSLTPLIPTPLLQIRLLSSWFF